MKKRKERRKKGVKEKKKGEGKEKKKMEGKQEKWRGREKGILYA